MISGLAVALLAAWVLAHLVSIGPLRDVTEVTMTWVLGLGAASALLAAFAVLGVGLMQGGTRPAWIRFVQAARTATALVGAALVVVGLMYYRDTEPRGDITWIAFGLVVLVGAAAVHGWLTRIMRKKLT